VTAPSPTVRRRRLTRSRLLRDLLVALVAYGLTLAVLHGMPGKKHHLDLLGGVLAAVACLPLLARRRSPLGVFVLTTAASASMNGLGYGLGPPFGPTLALFFVSTDERTRARMRQTAPVVLAMFAIHVGSTLIPDGGFPTSPILFGILVWGGAWVIGDQLRHRRQRHAELVERAERERRLAVAEERTRIARDLHDSAAHAINVILVQAGAARLLQQEKPEAAHEALTTIEDVARETIGEIDQLVRTLREDTDSGEPEPPTGLAGRETVVERSRPPGRARDVEING
jgi:signal transduction histidine kinase